LLSKLSSTLNTNYLKFAKMSYNLIHKGTLNTTDYRIFYEKDGKLISPFHDIPMMSASKPNTFNMVVEVPRWTNQKMEIATGDKMNPVKQDIKKGAVRFVNNCYPYHGYIWNYGCIPQTWENPNHKDGDTGFVGDNDPVDVCEIGSRVCERGEVIEVKVLGVLAMVDEGETDWKVIAIDVNDPDADKMNDISDVEKVKPGYLKDTREWFRIYKVPAGKPLNQFALNEEFQNSEYAKKVINETHGFWQQLIAGKAEHKLDITNTTVDGSAQKISQEEAQKELAQHPALNDTPAGIPVEKNYWHYVNVDQK